MGMSPIPGPCQAHEKCPNLQIESLEGNSCHQPFGKREAVPWEGGCVTFRALVPSR